MAEGSGSDGFQGARTGPAGVPAPGRGSSRGRAMTFQVWGWRREDAPQGLAWVPDAQGGRGAAMSRRTPGEPFARVLGASPSPLGRLAAGRKGSREGALGPGKMRGLALGAVWGPRSINSHHLGFKSKYRSTHSYNKSKTLSK